MPTASLKNSLLAGLRRSYMAGRNEPGLLALTNAIVGPTAVYPYEPIQTHVDIASATDIIPKLVLFRGPTYIVAFASDNKVYTLVDGETAWAETDISADLMNPFDVSETVTLDCDTNLWHFAAFQRGWIACNGVQCMFSIDGEDVRVDTITYPLSVCTFKGRVFYGGLARHWLRWDSEEFSSSILGESSLPAMTDGWCGWCTIKGDDILQHVYPEQAVSSYAGRLGVDILDNGDFSSGATDWTVGDWSYLTGPKRMAATLADATLTYTVNSAAFTKKAYRVSIDITRSAGAVDFSVGVDVGATVTYIGDLHITASGNYALYFEVDIPTAINELRFNAAAFTGSIFGVSMCPVEYYSEFTSWVEQQKLLQSGFAPAQDQGVVLCVKPLREHVIVYGENFITAYSPASIPVPTFGVSPLTPFGIAGRGAVGGDLEKHIFVDVSGKLWALGGDLEPKELGYEEFLRDAIEPSGASDIVISYDENCERFYISFTSAAYPDGRMLLLTAAGLSEVANEIVHCLAGTRYTATYADVTGFSTDGSSDAFYLLTDVFDFDTPGIKTVESVQVIGEGVETLRINVWHRSSQAVGSARGEWRTPDNRGEVFPAQSGVSFNIELTAADYSLIRIYDILVTFTFGGKANVKSISLRR